MELVSFVICLFFVDCLAKSKEIFEVFLSFFRLLSLEACGVFVSGTIFVKKIDISCCFFLIELYFAVAINTDMAELNSLRHFEEQVLFDNQKFPLI